MLKSTVRPRRLERTSRGKFYRARFIFANEAFLISLTLNLKGSRGSIGAGRSSPQGDMHGAPPAIIDQLDTLVRTNRCAVHFDRLHTTHHAIGVLHVDLVQGCTEPVGEGVFPPFARDAWIQVQPLPALAHTQNPF